MKIDRRSFLALGIGATAGITLSPLPWKITDDLSIWTQNWPWTPVPPDGEATETNSACLLCPGGCGITVRKIGERVVKVEGMKGHPINDGGICALGVAAPQLLYSPTRVKSPLKKVNGAWQNITWNDAIAEIAARLIELRAAGKSHTVACIAESDRGTVPLLWSRLLTVYGSPNFLRPATMEDAYALVMEKTQGHRGVPGFDLEKADFILSLGSGIIEGWGSPVRMFKAHAEWKSRRAKLVQVEPRLSNTAAKADQWLAAKPGTEAHLALGMAHVILSENLFNRRFTEQFAEGFEGCRQAILDQYRPEKVAETTGIPAETIRSLGREFARAKRPVAVCGRGQGLVPGSFLETAATHLLNALVGNINRKGGVWAMPEPEYVKWPEMEMDAVAASAMQKPRIDGAGGERFPDARYLLTQLPGLINSGAGDGIQVLFISGANPAYTLPGGQAVRQALERIPLKVSFATHMDETAAMADLILPNHCCLERYEDVPVTAGLTRPALNLAVPVVKPLYDTRQAGDVILALAQALGGNIAAAFPWKNYKTCLKQTLGDKWDTLKEEICWTDGEFKPAPWKTGFETPSAKFVFPEAARLTRSPIPAEGDGKRYPLTLIACDSMRLSSGAVGSPPFLIKIVPDTVLKDSDMVVEINPETAASLQLKDGAGAVLTTPRGASRVRIHCFHGIMPGVVAMQRGLGHGAHDKYLAGKGVSIHELMGPVDDPDSGYDAAWGIGASLTKA
ncbi:MAG: menaquinone reductase molybdopterin-binding-like subunit QrcB [Thermodesulfobacteriota bacterium]